jgi:hypothetical protein
LFRSPTPSILFQTLRQSVSPLPTNADTPHSSAHRVRSSTVARPDFSRATRESVAPPTALPCASAGKSQSIPPRESPPHPILAASNPGTPLHAPRCATKPQAKPARMAGVPIHTSISKQFSQCTQYIATVPAVRIGSSALPATSVIIVSCTALERKTR